MLAIVFNCRIDIANNGVNIFVVIIDHYRVALFKWFRSTNILSICTVLEKLHSYSHDLLNFLLMNMLGYRK